MRKTDRQNLPESDRELKEVSMGTATYNHRSFNGENPYYNVNTDRSYSKTDTFRFFNNIIGGVRIFDTAMFKPGNLGNRPEFIRDVVQYAP